MVVDREPTIHAEHRTQEAIVEDGTGLHTPSP